MSYRSRRDARRADSERRLMGETLGEFHARENPAPTAPGAGIPHVRCTRTGYLLASVGEPQRPTEDDTCPPDAPQRQGKLL